MAVQDKQKRREKQLRQIEWKLSIFYLLLQFKAINLMYFRYHTNHSMSGILYAWRTNDYVNN